MIRISLLFLALLGLAQSITAQVEFKGYSPYIKYPGSVSVSDDGRFIYAEGEQDLKVYTRDANTGSFGTLVQQIQDPGEEIIGNLVLSKNNRYAYASTYHKGQIITYARNEQTGKLKELARHTSQQGGIGDMNHPSNLTISPDGRLMTVYAARDGNKYLKIFRIESNGFLTFLNSHGSTRGFGNAQFDQSGQFIFMPTWEDHRVNDCSVGKYRIDPQNGALSFVDCMNNIFENNQYKIIISGGDFIISPDGNDIYAAGTDFKKNRDRPSPVFLHIHKDHGGYFLKQVLTNLEGYGINSNRIMAFDGNAEFLYIGSGGDINGVSVFKRATSGRLEFVKSFTSSQYAKIKSPWKMGLSADNKFIYTACMYGGGLTILENPNARPTQNNFSQPAPIVNNEPDPVDPPQPNPVSAQEGCVQPSFSASDLAQAQQDLQAIDSDRKRFDWALENLEGACMQTVQVIQLAGTFKSEYMKLEFVKFAFHYTSDPQNYHIIGGLFTQSSIKNSFQKYIE